MFPWSRKAKQARVRVAADAAALLGSVIDPYAEARARMCQAVDEAEARHWSQVAVRVAEATGRQIGLDTGTRMSMEADFSTAQSARRETTLTARAPTPDISGDELAVLELKRLMGANMRLFRLQFLGRSHSPTPNVVEEREVRASKSAAAIEGLRDAEWPRGALSVRLLDVDGVVLDERARFEK